ncbi:MAG TPA: cytochrome-c peroxidase [Polyangiales bacterium]|nr:cytochrome-c peroxidase [Polyangiales bacterium]
MRIEWGVVTILVACWAAPGCEDAEANSRGPSVGDQADDSREPLKFCARTASAEATTISPPASGDVVLMRPPMLDVATVVAEDAPPPMSGGTLILTRDGNWLVAADPDRDLIYVVSVERWALVQTLSLEKGDEPGRLSDDLAGYVHVALRGGRSIVSFRPDEAAFVRREICDLPRGIVFDPAHDLLHVACAEGRLVSVAADPQSSERREVSLGRDLRDVLMHDGKLFVSRFRAAELLELDAHGKIVRISKPPRFVSASRNPKLAEPSARDCVRVPEQSVPSGNSYSPGAAWRTLELPGRGIAMLHQQASEDLIRTSSGGYRGDFGGNSSKQCNQTAVRSALTLLDGSEAYGGPLGWSFFAIDFAVSPSSETVAVAGPGFWGVKGPQLNLLHSIDLRWTETGSCADLSRTLGTVSEQVTSVTFVDDEVVALQTREPAGITLASVDDGGALQRIDFAQPSRFDTGYALFHWLTAAGISCASCHVEGTEDGHVWNFQGIGLRRTQSLRGGILGTEPFHWNGDQAGFPELTDEVFTGRMSGFGLRPAEVQALASWIDRQPLLRVEAQADAAVERGRELFESASVGCKDCHSGDAFTNNETTDVGTGLALQVPSLRNVSFRTPLMHDGCAPELIDRFGPCGGDRHGNTSQLSRAQLQDLVAYLETL